MSTERAAKPTDPIIRDILAVNCSNDTVTLVQNLLFGAKVLASKTGDVGVKGRGRGKTTDAPARANGRKTTKAATGTQAKPGQVKIHEEELVQVCLRPEEKAGFATEVTNAALKGLSAAAKQMQLQQQRETSARSNGKPLQVRSPNSPEKVPSKSKLTAISEDGSEHNQSPTATAATAECASLALEFMRRNSNTKSLNITLENGTLAFVSKCLVLGLESLAGRELRAMKRRLDAAILGSQQKTIKKKPVASGRGVKGSASAGDSKAASSEDLEELLAVPPQIVDEHSAVRGIVISFQTSALKFIGVHKKHTADSRLLLKYLESENPISPVALLIQQQKQDPTDDETKAKSGRNLENIAQILLSSICLGVGSTSDAGAVSGGIDSDSTLRLQRLAFQTRVEAIKMTTRACQVDVEIWSVFSKCLAAFLRRSKSVPKTKYSLAKSEFEALAAALDLARLSGADSMSPTGKSKTPGKSSCLRMLGDLAQAAGLFDEAITLTQHSSSMMPVETQSSGSVKNAISTVRLAKLMLAAGDKTQAKVKEQMEMARGCLVDTLRGEAGDLDQLLMEAASYRRVLLAQFVEASEKHSARNEDVVRQCIHGVFACIRFLLRYLGTAPASSTGDGSKVLLRYNEKLLKASKAVSGFTDSVFHCCKFGIQNQSIEWQALDTALHDCFQVSLQFQSWMQSLGDSSTASSSEKVYDPERTLSKVSMLYWAYHNSARKSSSAPVSSLLQSLNRSIEVLQNTSIEVRKAGAYSTKLEALSHSYESAGRYQSAYDALGRSMRHHSDAGNLLWLAEAAATHSFESLWNSTIGISISSTLDTIPRLMVRATKSGSSFSWFDVDGLGGARGALMERQLQVYCNELLKGRSQDHGHSEVINKGFGTLFEIYSACQHPIRRLRAAVLASRIMNDLPDTLGDGILRIIQEAKLARNMVLGEDKYLEAYVAHYNASLSTNLALSDPEVDNISIKSALAQWKQLFDGGKAKADLFDSMPALLSQLQLLVDFFQVMCAPQQTIESLKLVLKCLDKMDSPLAAIEVQCQLALEYLRIGHTGQAHSILSKCQQAVGSEHTSPSVALRYHLTHASYFLAVGNALNCREQLSTAERLAHECPEVSHFITGSKAPTLQMLHKGFRILSETLEITATMLLQTGQQNAALQCAKRCLKVTQRLWVQMEGTTKSTATAGKFTDTSLDTSDTEFGSSSKPQGVFMQYESLRGARFWNIIPQLRRAYYLVAEIYAHNGLFFDAHANVTHSQRVVEALSSPISLIQQHSVMADLWIRGGDVESGQRHLDQAVEIKIKANGPSMELARHWGIVARMWKARGETDDQIDALDQAAEVLQALMQAAIPTGSLCSSEDALVSKMSSMRIRDEPAQAPTRGKGKLIKKAPVNAKPAAKISAKRVIPKPSSSRASIRDRASPSQDSDLVPLQRLRARMLTEKAVALQDRKDLDLAAETLYTVSSPQISTSAGSISRNIALFRQAAKIALRSMTADCTFGLLPESTISIPSLSGEILKSSPLVLENTTSKTVNGKRKPARAQAKSNDFSTILETARQQLVQYQPEAASISSTFEYQRLCSQLVSTSFLLSAAAPSLVGESATAPLATAWLLDHPAIVSNQRNKIAAKVAEKAFQKQELLEWPSTQKIANAEPILEAPALDDFQSRFIDIIPDSWTVISLNLSESKDDLYITRYKSNQTPFNLRLPLKCRSHSLDEEVFGYEEGRAELFEIIEQSNQTARVAATLSPDDSKAKGDWWAEREELDCRLEELLLNIERIWLGGFRGAFASQERQPLLMERFEKALLASLSRHLPSRRGKGGQKKPINLDRRVFELFTGLGEPKDGQDDEDFEESLADLLHFIVDTLQFNGEANAYDEIDFDSMIVETTDALKAYHSASIEASRSKQHTILLLDKDLHCIPWESLPCLFNSSVSRLPSLESFRSKLLAAQAQENHREDAPGHRISRGSNGVSLLNPSGDLKRTQDTLQPLLQSIPGDWIHSNEDPSEQQLVKYLSSTDLYLYFGHGSGAQFMRPRALREKDTCPTAWLMGCSSAAINTHGEFEPTALLLSILEAGSPAVVGCLWDVTDKDCDRASIQIGHTWGLWTPMKQHAKLLSDGTMATKGSNKKLYRQQAHRDFSVQEVENPRGVSGAAKVYGSTRGDKMGAGGQGRLSHDRPSLVEAVKMGRETCRLRYLNGAALVVYGIPVYLDD
jgi:separase